MRASTGLGSWLVAALLTTVHGTGRPTHQELVATIARLEARMDVMEHKVAALEKEAGRTNTTDRSTPPQEQRHSGSVAENNGTGISQGHPSFTEVLGRWTSMDKTPVTPDHNHEETKRLLLTAGGDGPVAFMARMDASKDHIGINQNYVFETVLMNNGNGYHDQHGIFIAPKAGIYIFSATLLTNRGDEHLNGAIVHNGNIVCMIHIYASDWIQSSQTALIQVQQGDEVWVRNINADNISIYGGGFSTFSGYLLWPM